MQNIWSFSDFFLCVLGRNEASGTRERRLMQGTEYSIYKQSLMPYFSYPDVLRSCRPPGDLRSIVCTCPAIYQPMTEIHCKIKYAGAKIQSCRFGRTNPHDIDVSTAGWPAWCRSPSLYHTQPRVSGFCPFMKMWYVTDSYVPCNVMREIKISGQIVCRPSSHLAHGVGTSSHGQWKEWRHKN